MCLCLPIKRFLIKSFYFSCNLTVIIFEVKSILFFFFISFRFFLQICKYARIELSNRASTFVDNWTGEVRRVSATKYVYSLLTFQTCHIVFLTKRLGEKTKIYIGNIPDSKIYSNSTILKTLRTRKTNNYNFGRKIFKKIRMRSTRGCSQAMDTSLTRDPKWITLEPRDLNWIGFWD